MANNKKKTNVSKKKNTSSNKTKKSTSVKKSSTKKVSNTNIKKTTPKKKVNNSSAKVNSEKNVKNKINVKILEPEKIEIPKKKQIPKIKEVSKNKNEAKKVVKTEKTIEKKVKIEEPTRVEKVEKAIKENIKKSASPLKGDISKAIQKNKKSKLTKRINKLKRKIKMYGFNSVFPIKTILIGIIIIGLVVCIPIIVKNVLFNKSNVDLSNISEKIDQLKTVSYNIDDTNSIISSSNAFTGMKDYYEYDFKNVFDLEPNYVKEYVIKYNKSKGYVFIAIKPTENNEDNVKNTIEKFLKSNKIDNYEYLEYGHYQIFIKSKDENSDKLVISKIRQSQIRVFNILQELKKEDIEKVIGISSTYYSSALVKTAMLRTETCQYMIFKPTNEMSKTKIKNTVNDYYAGLESKWQSTNKENYELVKNRHFEEYNGLLIYIVSHDNDLVMNLIKN